MTRPTHIQRQSRLFFLILYILASAIIWLRTDWLRPMDLPRALGLAGGFALTLAAAPFLTPVFKLVTALTRRLGSLIFGVISLLVYFLILSPLAVIMRLAGKRFLAPGAEEAESWYVEWTPGESVDKQY